MSHVPSRARTSLARQSTRVLQDNGARLHALPAPKINGQPFPGASEAFLRRNQLLEPADAWVYVTCGPLDASPPFNVELHWGEGNVLGSQYVTEDFATVVFQVKGMDLAGVPDGDGFTGDGRFAVFCRLDFEGATSDTPITYCTVKCSQPGGAAKDDGSTPWVNENLEKAAVVPNPVPGAPGSTATVLVPGYDVRAIGDHVTFEWGGKKLHYDVVDLDRPPSAIVDWETLRAVGGGSVPVTWSVTDIVGNWSRHAPSIRVEVQLDEGQLLSPHLRYSSARHVDDPLELETLDKQPVLLRLPVHDLDLRDTVVGHWEATLPDGSKRSYTTEPMTWDDDIITYFDVAIPYAEALTAADGTVAVWYVVNGREGDDTATSRKRRYRVTEGGAARLPEPIVTGRVANRLDPFAQGAYIELAAPYTPDAIVAGSSVIMHVVGTRGNEVSPWSDGYVLSSGDIGQPVLFYCPAEVLQAVENGSATFQYEVIEGKMQPGTSNWQPTAAPRQSEMLTLDIRREGALPDYPAPTVDGVVDGELNPDLPFTTVRIPTPATGGPPVGSEVTLNWRGKVPYSTTGKVPATGELTLRINKPNIDDNRDSEVSVSYTAGGRPSDVETFFVGTKLAGLPPPAVDDAPGGVLQPIKAKDGLRVRVPAALSTSDMVTVHFDTYDSSPIRWSPDLIVTVPAGEVARRLGTTVPVSYTVNGERTSPALQLNVKPIDDGDATILPTPRFKELRGDVLDTSGMVTLHVDPWPLMAVNQKVWCTVHGVDTDDKAISDTLWRMSPVLASELSSGCNKEMNQVWYRRLKNGSRVTIEFAVTFDGSEIKDNAIIFPVKSYGIQTIPYLEIDRSVMMLEVGKTATRRPTGGKPPYFYETHHPNTVSVDANGTVKGLKAGGAGISVSDSLVPPSYVIYNATVR